MNNDFQTLVEFLDRCGPEVTGHSVSVPEKAEEDRLLRFAAGTCSDRERTEICTLLRLHPTWMRWLGDRVKADRLPTRQATV